MKTRSFYTTSMDYWGIYDDTQDGGQLSLSKYAYREVQTLVLKG